MKIFKAGDISEDELGKELMKTVEQQTEKKVFTMRILGERENALDTVIIFDDKTVLMSKISVMEHEGNLAYRIQGDYI